MSTLTFTETIIKPDQMTPWMKTQILRMYASGYNPETIARLANCKTEVVHAVTKNRLNS